MHRISLTEAIADMRASLDTLERAIDNMGMQENTREPGRAPRTYLTRPSSIASTVAKLIETSQGVASKDIVEAISPLTTSPKASVSRTITRLYNAGRIKRVDGRWFPIDAPGQPDIIPQRRNR